MFTDYTCVPTFSGRAMTNTSNICSGRSQNVRDRLNKHNHDDDMLPDCQSYDELVKYDAILKHKRTTINTGLNKLYHDQCSSNQKGPNLPKNQTCSVLIEVDQIAILFWECKVSTKLLLL